LLSADSLADRVCFFGDYTSAFDMQDYAFSLPCDIGVCDFFNMDLATLCEIISDDALWKRLVLTFLKSEVGLLFAKEFKVVRENRRALALHRIRTPGFKERHDVADQLMKDEAEVARKLLEAAPAKVTKAEKLATTRRALALKKTARVLANEVREAWKQ
jgi:hypothetical protein